MIGIDTSSMVILLLIAFIAWTIPGLEWLFLGLLILFLLTSGSIAISVFTLMGVAVLYLLELKQYWFVLMFILVGLILLLEGRRKKPREEEYYSPELMQLLGGAE